MFGLVPTTTTTTTLTSTIPYCPAESQAGCIATTVPQVAQSVSTSVPTTTIQSTTIATPNTWIATASYPLSIDDQSCSPYNGYAYCIGGTQGGMSLTGSVYYARINSNGTPGNWMQTTTTYPIFVAMNTSYAGYGISLMNNNITSISANWTVPYVSYGTISQWIGIDGDGRLIQIGTFSEATGTYITFNERYPLESMIYGFKVNSKDHMYANITELSSGVWNMFITDVSTKQSYSLTESYPITNDWAIYVVEAPLWYTISSRIFGNFSNANFTNINAVINGESHNLCNSDLAEYYGSHGFSLTQSPEPKIINCISFNVTYKTNNN